MSIDHRGTPLKTSAQAEIRRAKKRPAEASPLRHPWLGTGLWSHRAGATRCRSHLLVLMRPKETTPPPIKKGHPGQGCPSAFVHGLGNNSGTRYANTWPGDRSTKTTWLGGNGS